MSGRRRPEVAEIVFVLILMGVAVYLVATSLSGTAIQMLGTHSEGV